MKFARCGLPNYPEDRSIYPVKKMDHTKVYPFTVSLPRYASSREYVRTLLNQLKSCPNCSAAADEFPVSLLPRVQMLPNGKNLIFKGLASASEQWRISAEDCYSESAFTPQARVGLSPK
ncbi:hypothetical protein KC19_10G040200 [Ceratodon purpureus]|uniref:Uncharacterized protein n=1 Tax=Ceratodon purpureus TaxID=3225 RepID=A0A8T0GNJ1_CERPU|nr:hypothetical protein KC19_10G040200 [Ceratodon purpureus]